MGKVEIDIEGLTDRSKVREIKTRSSRNAKAYRAVIYLESPILNDESDLKEISSAFTNTLIQQRTPLRVVHRRADKIRTRKVISFEVEKIEPQQITVHIICEGGLYVKELINGDEGRTQPSFSDRLGIPSIVTELDVIEVMEKKDSL